MIEIYFRKIGRNKTKKSSIRKAAQSVLDIFSRSDSLTIMVVNDQYIQELNSQYRHMDAVTDVLSFPNEENDPMQPSYLGDIAISYPVAEKQAAVAGHPVENEISLLIVHGVLHLLGYDHHTSEGKSEMWALQEKALRSLGIMMTSYSGDNDG